MRIGKFLPILDWLPNYKSTQFQGDLLAGITVGIMLIPQGMAYAMIAGLPPIYGLYASTVPLILYAILGTSRQLAVGPVAMVSLLTAAGIGALAQGGSETYIALAIALALFVGLTQFFLGIFRLGFLVNFLSHPVISGFTSAAALIIGLSQLKHLLGIDIPRSHHIHEILLNAIGQLGLINWATFAIGAVGIVLILGVKKINKRIPGPLLAVVFGIVAVWGFGLTEFDVKIVGSIPEGLPSMKLPMVSFEEMEALLPIALVISIISFMESIAVAKAIESKHKDYKVVPNQELIALGAANIGGAFFQSYPVTGGFSRTAVNDQSGARTGMASIISAVLIILTLLFFTPLFYFLPKAILASVIMVAVFGLIDFREAIHLWKTNRSDFVMLFVTFIATLGLGIEQGIGVGVVLSLAMVIYRTTQPHVAVLGRIPGTHFYRNIDRFPNIEQRPDLLILRFDAPLYFANANFFKETLQRLSAQKDKALKAIILNAESISTLDSTAIHTLEETLSTFNDQNIQLYFTGVIGPVRDSLFKTKLIEKIGNQNFFMSVQEAVDYFDQTIIDDQTHGGNDRQKYTLQSNVGK